MTNFQYFLLSFCSILFPFIMCCLKFSVMRNSFRPFAMLIFGGALVELLAYFFIKHYGSNLWLLNIFSLFESLIIFRQFNKWGLLSDNNRLMLTIVILGSAAWLVENFIISTINENNRIYLITYYFAIVLLSIRQINKDMIQGSAGREELARLIICTGMLLFFTFGLVRETFAASADFLSLASRRKIFLIVSIANVISNIIYGVGIAYIPKQKKLPDLFNSYRGEIS